MSDTNSLGEGGASPAILVGQGRAAGVRHVLQAAVTVVGRAEDCDLRLDDPLASRHHAEVRREPWRYVLVDLGSRNGTQVNGQLFDGPYQLQNGDRILIAATPLQFEDPNATIAVERGALQRAHLPVWLDAGAGEAFVFGQRLDLAPKELALLALLYERAGVVCDKDEIARTVWPEYNGIVSDYNIEALVSRLRHKLEQAGTGGQPIVNVKKRGYRLAIPGE